MFRIVNLPLCIIILMRCSFTLGFSVGVSLSVAESPSPSSSPQSDVTEKSGESFRDWEEWNDRYPQCDAEHNSNTSPIDINADNIVQSPNMKAFLVHSRLPVDDCLTMSIFYKDGDLEMEAVTIKALPACLRQLTHVYGRDERESNIRFFKQAVFFFTNTAPEEERSLHRIEGKEFQMEIMMEFVDIKEQYYTQIFSLVETKSPETTPANPIFTILESALSDLKNEIISEAAGNTSRALKLKALQTACLTNEQKYLQSDKETKEISAFSTLEKVEELLAKIKGTTNMDLKRLTEKKQSTATENLEGKAEKLEELRENRAKLFEIMKGEKRPLKLKELQELFITAQLVIKKLESQIKLGVGGTDENEQKLENMKEMLRANKVGIPGESPFPGMLYDCPDAVHAKLRELKEKVNNFVERKRLYDTSCKEASEFKKLPYAFVKINDPFQISWLFPRTGGYYIYEGSSPIPKCEQRDTTIVFSEPLSISTEQLAVFQNLPSLEALRREGARISSSDLSIEDKLKVDKMIPVLADTEASRPVKYVRKRPIFLNDDGYHGKNTVIKSMTRTLASGSTLIKVVPKILILVLINYILLFYTLFEELV